MKLSFRGYIFGILIILFSSIMSFAQSESLRTKIANIIHHSKGHIGVAVMDLDNGDTLTVNNDYGYPMQSVYKFPIALAMLHEIDRGKFSLNQKIRLTKENLHPNMWSPLRKKYPNANVDITLGELLKFTVAESDNNGCDILFKLLGGPAEVNKYIKNLGITGMSIAATEMEMHKDWTVQYKNSSTPYAMVNLLYNFYHDNILSAKSKDFLWNIMNMNIFGSNRIKGELPPGTIVAHKTGSSDVNSEGIAAATNDAGIVVLPNGKRFAIVVFVSDSPDKETARDKVIADIAKAAWDEYSFSEK